MLPSAIRTATSQPWSCTPAIPVHPPPGHDRRETRARPRFQYYDLGIEQDVFIKDAATSRPMVGAVWPMYSVFPDFLNPATSKYWHDAIADFLALTGTDGLWIDMNEPVRPASEALGVDAACYAQERPVGVCGGRFDRAVSSPGQLLHGIGSDHMQLPEQPRRC